PWLATQPALSQEEDRPPPGEKIKKLLANGDERAARELRLQVLWTRQLGEELVVGGAPVVKTIDDCLDPERAYELLPGSAMPADLVDYLLVLRDEPCVRTVPDSLLKAVSWMEKLAEFKLLRATGLAWAAKDKIVAIERVVLDDSEPTGLRVYAWAKLVKVWASLRWSDLQAIRPGELKLVEGRLVTTLRRTKMSGPNGWRPLAETACYLS
ncbi:unnamed protein product, partial [Symbiodinium pilosum]